MPRRNTPRTSRQARGYDHKHDKTRTRWTPIVEAGQVECHAIICLMPSRWIQPGTPWDLGHTPDRTAYTGPEHRKCNRSEGATRGNRARNTPPDPRANPRSREW